MPIFQTADKAGADPTAMSFISNDDDPLPALSYVEITDPNGVDRYFGQIEAPGLNINRMAGDPTSPQAIAMIEAAVGGHGRHSLENTVQQDRFYSVRNLAHRRDGAWSSPLIRPSIGSLAQHASAEVIREVLKLADPRNSSTSVVGHLLNADRIPLAINGRMLLHHAVAAGSTGSGKSELLANIMAAAADWGWSVVVFDHKPDYGCIDQPREADDSADPRRGLADVVFYSLGDQGGAPVTVQACELDVGLMAGTILHRNNEDQQREVFEMVLQCYKDEMDDCRKTWTLEDFYHKYLDKKAAEVAEALPVKTSINSRTWDAIRSKHRRPGRKPAWIDRSRRRGAIGPVSAPPVALRMDDILVPGRVNVFRIPHDNAASRAYALFLDYLTGQVTRARVADRSLPKVLFVVDEAADMFAATDRTFARQVTSSMAELVRKGRSLGEAFLFGVQSAGDLPPEVRQNLNSSFIGRHRSPSILREILPTQDEAVFRMSTSLRPGEFLVDLFGTQSLLKMQGLRTPCRLMKEEDGTDGETFPIQGRLAS